MNEKLTEATIKALQGKLTEEVIPNNEGQVCPKCKSKNYIEVDDSEYDDGTQEYHFECQDCGYSSDTNKYSYCKSNYNEVLDCLDSMSDSPFDESEEDVIKDIMATYPEYDSQQIADIYNEYCETGIY